MLFEINRSLQEFEEGKVLPIDQVFAKLQKRIDKHHQKTLATSTTKEWRPAFLELGI